jgi:hypothetical protein
VNLEKIVIKGTFDNLNFVICSFVIFGQMSKIDIANKVVYFGANGAKVFQGLETGVTIQLVNKYCPFVVGIHSMAHWCNLVVQTLSSLTLVTKIEGLFFSMYTYYN